MAPRSRRIEEGVGVNSGMLPCLTRQASATIARPCRPPAARRDAEMRLLSLRRVIRRHTRCDEILRPKSHRAALRIASKQEPVHTAPISRDLFASCCCCLRMFGAAPQHQGAQRQPRSSLNLCYSIATLSARPTAAARRDEQPGHITSPMNHATQTNASASVSRSIKGLAFSPRAHQA